MSYNAGKNWKKKQQKTFLTSKDGPFFYGAFYRDDKEDGFCLTLESKNGKPTADMIRMMIETNDKMLKDFEMMPKEVQDEEIRYQRGFRDQEIVKFNNIAFPKGRPMGMTNDVPDAAYKHGIMAASAIHFLTSVGDIKNDEFNGMHFMYDDAKVASVA